MARRSKTDSVREDRSAITQLEAQLENLKHLTVGLLQVEWERVFKEPARSRNKDFLRKRIGFRLQEIALGGLSERAQERSKALAADAPLRRRSNGAKPPASNSPAAVISRVETPRDPRLPPPGTLLRRTHNAREHVVRVLDDGFAYDGRNYRSLSAIAKQIVGSEVNGFAWFRLSRRPESTK